MKSQALNLIRSIRTVVKSKLAVSKQTADILDVLVNTTSCHFSSADIPQRIRNYYKDAVWLIRLKHLLRRMLQEDE